MTIGNSYDGFIDFEIVDIEGTETGPTPDEIQFQYTNPAIGIDTGSTFVVHDIIGGATVRQRIGDQPLEISVDGVCTEETAKQIELLRNANSVTLFSDRFNGDSVTVHIASLNTDPLEEGGAGDIKTGEFLYSFSLNCVEILNTGD
jgi:hypothetical protein